MAFAALVLAIVSAATPGPAGAQDDGSGLDPTVFDVVQVSGFVDRIVAAHLLPERVCIARAQNWQWLRWGRSWLR